MNVLKAVYAIIIVSLYIAATGYQVYAQSRYSFDSPRGVRYEYTASDYPGVNIPQNAFNIANEYVDKVDIKHIEVYIVGGNLVVELELYGSTPTEQDIQLLASNSMYIFYGGQIHMNYSGTNIKFRFDISFHPMSLAGETFKYFFAIYDPRKPRYEINVTDHASWTFNGNKVEISYDLGEYAGVQFYPATSTATFVAVSTVLGYFISETASDYKIKEDMLYVAGPVKTGGEENQTTPSGDEETGGSMPPTQEMPGGGISTPPSEEVPQGQGGLQIWFAVPVVAVIAAVAIYFLKIRKP